MSSISPKAFSPMQGFFALQPSTSISSLLAPLRRPRQSPTSYCPFLTGSRLPLMAFAWILANTKCGKPPVGLDSWPHLLPGKHECLQSRRRRQGLQSLLTVSANPSQQKILALNSSSALLPFSPSRSVIHLSSHRGDRSAMSWADVPFSQIFLKAASSDFMSYGIFAACWI